MTTHSITMSQVSLSPNDDSAINVLRANGVTALADCFEQNRQRLKALIRTRINYRLRTRVDGSDIIQDAYLKAASQLESYLENPRMPVFLWLRLLTLQSVHERNQFFTAVQKRDPSRELPVGDGVLEGLIDQLVATALTPHTTLQKNELIQNVRVMVSELKENDREILTLVHLERLSLTEASVALDLNPETTRKRHLRAMKRLRGIVGEMDRDQSF